MNAFSWIGVGVFSFGVTIWLVKKIFFSKKKKCRHNWAAKQIFILRKDGKDYPRVAYFCNKCGVAVHNKLLSYSELKLLKND